MYGRLSEDPPTRIAKLSHREEVWLAASTRAELWKDEGPLLRSRPYPRQETSALAARRNKHSLARTLHRRLPELVTGGTEGCDVITPWGTIMPSSEEADEKRSLKAVRRQSPGTTLSTEIHMAHYRFL
ncbi:hypothetical protein Bbelb_150680 [Branchiostoma belcheri]|nr:hypothetical protein Bbelb_150680 [Branchiostoma belcheri]